MEHQGIWSLVPTLVVLGIALYSKRTFEALLGGALVGFVILHKENFFSGFADSMLAVMQDATIGWIILVCGLFGSLIQVLVKTGGAGAFAKYLLRYVKSERSALVITWMLGLVIFIDDYLNALTIGNSMQKVTDKFRVPREMLAYIVDSTAAPICVLIPLSTWAIYVASLLEATGVSAQGEGLAGYLMAIPYTVYGWVAVLIVPLVAWKIIPPLGAMKKAVERTKAGGSLAPEGSENMGMQIEEAEGINPVMADFILPILVLIGATIWFDIDAFKGILTAMFFVLIYQGLIRRQLSFKQVMDESFAGFKTMIYALSIIVMSFVLKEVNDGLGLTQFVIDTVKPLMDKAWLPGVAFLALSVVTFSTGSFWGVYAISLPIVIPLAQSMDVNIWLAVGAVISSGAFGSHACFYGDSTILSAAATGCNNVAHAITQLPYTLIAGGISFVIYVLLGFWV